MGTIANNQVNVYSNQIIDSFIAPDNLKGETTIPKEIVIRNTGEEEVSVRISYIENWDKKEDSDNWYDKMWNYSVELFRSLDIPVRKLVCCSGDLADLKYRSCDIEAWSPRQKKYFEVCSCSNLTDAQARRLKIRYKKEDGQKVFAHTLNNTVIAPPRMLIAFLENNLNSDGSVKIPEVLRPYMGGKEKIEVKD